jgi:hypothetical protein
MINGYLYGDSFNTSGFHQTLTMLHDDIIQRPRAICEELEAFTAQDIKEMNTSSRSLYLFLALVCSPDNSFFLRMVSKIDEEVIYLESPRLKNTLRHLSDYILMRRRNIEAFLKYKCLIPFDFIEFQFELDVPMSRFIFLVDGIDTLRDLYEKVLFKVFGEKEDYAIYISNVLMNNYDYANFQSQLRHVTLTKECYDWGIENLPAETQSNSPSKGLRYHNHHILSGLGTMRIESPDLIIRSSRECGIYTLHQEDLESFNQEQLDEYLGLDYFKTKTNPTEHNVVTLLNSNLMTRDLFVKHVDVFYVQSHYSIERMFGNFQISLKEALKILGR